MRQFIQSDSLYTYTNEWFSKLNVDNQLKDNVYTKIQRKESIVNQCNNNIQLLGRNTIFDTNPFEIQKEGRVKVKEDENKKGKKKKQFLIYQIGKLKAI